METSGQTNKLLRGIVLLALIAALVIVLSAAGRALAEEGQPAGQVCTEQVIVPVCTEDVQSLVLVGCGDGECRLPETILTCPDDCRVVIPTLIPNTCGDGSCDLPETSLTCPGDCGPILPTIAPTLVGDKCGDGACVLPETALTCPADCGNSTIPVCGDGACVLPETSLTCPADCGTSTVPVCGDGVCQPPVERPATCPADCRPPATVTPVPPTPTKIPPTATREPPTPTRVPPTQAANEQSSTEEAPTSTLEPTEQAAGDVDEILAVLDTEPPHVVGGICHIVLAADVAEPVRKGYKKRVGEDAEVWIICSGHPEELCLPAVAAAQDASGTTQFLECDSTESCRSFRAEVAGEQACVTAKVLVQPSCGEGCAFAPGTVFLPAQDVVPTGFCTGVFLLAGFGVWMVMVRRRGLEIDEDPDARPRETTSAFD